MDLKVEKVCQVFHWKDFFYIKIEFKMEIIIKPDQLDEYDCHSAWINLIIKKK